MPSFSQITSLLSATLLLGYGLPAVRAVPAALVPRQYTQDDPTVPAAAWKVCDGGADATTILSVAPWDDGSGIVETVGKCSDGSAPKLKIRRDDDVLEKRQTSCPRPPSTCSNRFQVPGSLGSGYVQKCGASCTTHCYDNSGVNPSDCGVIFDGFTRRSGTNQILSLEPNNFVLQTWGSCGTGIRNQILASQTDSRCTTKMIYDYNDWAGVGYWISRDGPCRNRGGICVGDTGVYIAGTSDFYIQVYHT